MTIQAVILNKGSLILASDMAITMDVYKSYTGVKKIFEINENVPMGIMINGLMDFEKVPIETLIGEFKSQVKGFRSVEKVKDDFLKFLSKNTPYTFRDDYLAKILIKFKDRLCYEILDDGFDEAISNKPSKEIPPFVKKYHNFDEEFLDIIPESYDKPLFNLKIWEIFSHELSLEGTGIIFAGFDKAHHYPSLFVINVYCNDYGNIIYEEVESYVNCEEPLIRVYAINEEAYSFMTGVSDDFEIHIKNHIKETNEEIVENMKWYLENENITETEKILTNLKTELDNSYIELSITINDFKLDMLEDTYDSCEYLPRQILSELANSLIKLTALKQKISLDLETVSSENDILLITKPYNVKWLKFTEEIV
jgi:hypothetical protein